MDDEIKAGADVLLSNDPEVMPTDQKLKEDAGSLVSQYLHFWKPGEVECVVILTRPDSNECVYACSDMRGERLRGLLRAVQHESSIQGVLVRKHQIFGRKL